MAQIFLSYAREDEEKVEKLYQKLSEAGLKPWMDKKDILPGERWEFTIRKAIRRSDFFLACLSANSIEKRGWVQREIKQALDTLQEMLDSDIYLIPVRLEDCEVPESLRDFQWVNPFERDGWIQLVEAIQVGMERRKAVQAGVERRTDVIKLIPEEGPEQLVAASHTKAVGFLDRLAEVGVTALKNQKLEELYKQGIKALVMGEWEKAILLLQQVIDIDPYYKDAAFRLDEAKKHLEKEQKLEGRYKQGIEALVKGEWEKAILSLQQVIDIDPYYKDAVFRLEEARRQMEKARPMWEVLSAPAHPRRPVNWEKIGAIVGVIAVLIALGAWLAPNVRDSLVAWLSKTPTVTLIGSPTHTSVISTATPSPTAIPTSTATDMPSPTAAPTSAATDTPSPIATPTSTATHTPSPTATPPPTATDTPGPPTSPPVPTPVPQPALTIYLRRTETDFAALTNAQVNEGLYKEGQFVYGDAAVRIGDTVYHFDKPEVGPGEPEQLPDPWRVEFEFAPDLVARTGNQAGFDAKKARFWVGTLDSGSAIGKDSPYSLTMRLYEGDKEQGSIQVFFAVADAPGNGGGGGTGGKPTPPP